MCCLLKKNVKKIRTNKVYSTNLPGHPKLNAELDISKKRWIAKYSQRLLKLWLQRQSPLGVTRTYVEQIEQDLAKFYDEPLKRIFIEKTFH
jgi:hypothetical protein